MVGEKELILDINGREQRATVPANETLLETLRGLAHFEVKSGCEKGDCGACAVLVDGEALDACLTLTWTVEGRALTTAAGFGEGADMHPITRAFIVTGAVQCGYCTPGLIIAAHSLLARSPAPSRDEIRHGLSGNLCRCTGYTKVFQAVEDAARVMRAAGSGA